VCDLACTQICNGQRSSCFC